MAAEVIRRKRPGRIRLNGMLVAEVLYVMLCHVMVYVMSTFSSTNNIMMAVKSNV